MRVFSFPPIEPTEARILVLGSMPGVASLDAHQYYAHPRNAFWPIMGELFGAHPTLSYAERVAVLQQRGIAVWDVLASCERPGSLDAHIKTTTMEVNDFAALFSRQPSLTHIFFNGATAEQSFRRHVVRHNALDHLYLCRLPSTSPAHASLTLAQKIEAWSVLRNVLL